MIPELLIVSVIAASLVAVDVGNATVSIDTIALVVIALFNMVTALLTWRTHNVALVTQANVQKVELATNSMKDALITSTRLEAHAAGLQEGRDEGAEKAATLAAGQAQGAATRVKEEEEK